MNSKMIELPKPPNAPGNLSDSVFVTEAEVRQLLAGIRARHEIRDKRFAEFAERIGRS